MCCKELKNRSRRIFIFFFLFLLKIDVLGQFSSSGINQLINNEKLSNNIILKYAEEVKSFYHLVQFQPVWVGQNDRAKELFRAIAKSADLGLEIKDYERSPIRLFSNGNLLSSEDSIKAEISFTDVAIHFLHDIKYGNSNPSLGYNGLNYSPDCSGLPQLLATILSNNQLSLLPQLAEPASIEYLSLKQLIIRYTAIGEGNTFKEIVIRSGKVSNTNKELVQKIYQLGLMDSANQQVSDSLLKEKVKAAQAMFNLLADGVLRTTTIEALNIPLAARLKELKQALNTIRWLSGIKDQQKVIVVNIPSATLLVYDKNNVVLESRIIVGKRSTPTPTLCSKVSEVILYPYWMVPYSIATKELLPSIKRNTNFIDAGNYQVINQQGKIVDPSTVNWSSLSASNFPYIIRQSTGCDNALGLIKLNFYNPFSVYLHDTPNKNLFSMNKRYFSHGCMRVEKAMELGRIVLKNNFIAIDTLSEKGCLYNQSPIVVPADENIPVFVLYNTAWIDASGRASFHEDIYRRNKYLK